ncbi:MAG TPA: response regulator [Candidatus Krumholzibacteria bacterium]
MARILIADDDAHIVRVMAIWLQRHGHACTTARNGQEALESVGAGGVDIVITDMNMPVLDGIELAKSLRQRKVQVPIVMLTARCDQEALNESLSEYAVRVFPKPFLPSQLVAEIDRLLNPVAS